MEIDKALEVINNVTANVNGTRQDHQIIVQAIQVITLEVKNSKEAQAKIIELNKEIENLKSIVNPEEVVVEVTEEVKEKKSK